MTPAQLIVATLGNGPCTETRLISRFIDRGYNYESAKLAVANALVECFQAKRIEMPISGVYRLTAAAAPMEGGK